MVRINGNASSPKKENRQWQQKLHFSIFYWPLYVEKILVVKQ